MDDLDADGRRDMMAAARAFKGQYTLDEFRAWFAVKYPQFMRAGKFFALYIFYAAYLVYEEQLRANAPFEHWYNERGSGPSGGGGPMRWYASADDPNASVVDEAFSAHARRHKAQKPHA